MSERRLEITFRYVPQEERDEHARLWQPLRDAAQRAGAHAWRFVLEPDPAVVVEFLEYPAPVDLPGLPEIAEGRATLARHFPAAPDVPRSARWQSLD